MRGFNTISKSYFVFEEEDNLYQDCLHIKENLQMTITSCSRHRFEQGSSGWKDLGKRILGNYP
jgi:hypothetical protein